MRMMSIALAREMFGNFFFCKPLYF